jgi:hypothetical protein
MTSVGRIERIGDHCLVGFGPAFGEADSGPPNQSWDETAKSRVISHRPLEGPGRILALDLTNTTSFSQLRTTLKSCLHNGGAEATAVGRLNPPPRAGNRCRGG